MGVGTSKALQARRREVASHVDRLIAQADERSPIGSVRRAQIKEGARLARRRIKTLAVAREAVAAIELEIGHALIWVVDQGMSRNEAFELAGLSRHLGRRYIELALRAQSQVAGDFSTNSRPEGGLPSLASDLDHDGTNAAVGTPGRKR